MHLQKCLTFGVHIRTVPTLFLNVLPLYKLFQKLRKGNDQKSDAKIADTVYRIKQRATRDPYHRLPKTKTEKQRLRGRVQNSEGKSVQGAHDRIYRKAEPPRHFFRKQHGDRPKDRPNIEIWEPPYVKSRKDAVKHYVNVDRDQRSPSKGQGQHHRQHSEQVNVWERLHYDLGAEHQSAQHREDRHPKHSFFDRIPFPQTVCFFLYRLFGMLV